MAGVVKAMLWAWIIAKSVASSSLPEITDEVFIDECVREHNRARSSVTPAASDMLYLTWDEDLAMTAREWARRCLFEHNPDLKGAGRMRPNASSVGENIWAGYPPTPFSAAGAIQKWVDEKRDYDYDRNGCADVCGHYKQVVWGDTNKVGCAAHFCPGGVQATTFADKEGVIFVCNYAPAGNINGRQPYRSEGKACSGCQGACVEKLCRTAGSPKTVPLQSSDFNYGTILVIRPLGVIATLATAYGLHHFYPNIFCYE